MPAHSTLTGSSLHEPKGVATAVANTVYAANGSGSGAWVDPNTLITTSVFTAGDVKATFKTSETGWVLMNDGTIGDATSGATTRANADCEDLFTVMWNNVSNTYAAVSGGRGVSAAADWAAHKTLALPKVLGRALASAGAGSGLTSRSLGETAGAETATISQANLPNVNFVNFGITLGDTTHTHGVNGTINTTPYGDIGVGSGATGSLGTGGSIAAAASGVYVATQGFSASGGSGTGHANVQPSAFLNFLVKL